MSNKMNLLHTEYAKIKNGQFSKNLTQLGHILFKIYIANNLIILQIPFLGLRELSKVISIEQRKN